MFMLDRSFSSCQQKTFFFTHQVDQFFVYTYMMQKQFSKDSFTQFKQIFILPCRTPTLQKEMRSLHTLIRTTRTFIYHQYRVLLGNKFSKFNELYCNYRETFYVLGTVHTLFYLVVFIYQQFYIMFQFQRVQAS